MSPEHEALLDSVRGVLSKDGDLWGRLVELGIPALPIPEAAGGAGFALADALVAAEEIGYSLRPTPLLASLVASAALLEIDGTEELLGQIAGGTIATLAWDGPHRATASGREPVRAVDGRLSGTVEAVLEGGTAEIVLVAAEAANSVGLYAVSEEGTPLATMDPTLSLGRLTLTDAPATLLAADATSALAAAHRAGCLTVAALQVGTARRGLDMTVEYSKQREQFGRPIGSFQALKHRMADMLVQVEMAKSALLSAVAGDTSLAAASTYCSEALAAVAAETIQLHGGIAITWEHDAHLVFKRAHSLGRLFGTPADQRQLAL